jgi:hypothetical protein
MRKRAVFKLVNNVPVILCSKCSCIIKYGKYFTNEEEKAFREGLKIKPQFCDKCEEEMELF